MSHWGGEVNRDIRKEHGNCYIGLYCRLAIIHSNPVRAVRGSLRTLFTPKRLGIQKTLNQKDACSGGLCEAFLFEVHHEGVHRRIPWIWIQIRFWMKVPA